MDVRFPNGTIVNNVPDYITQEELLERLKAAGYDTEALLRPASTAPVPTPEVEPERTFGGYAKEAIKGIVPGIVGLGESAITGAASILPEAGEKAVREAVSGVTEPIREYFAPAPGYEDTFVRKLSEGVGSTVPFLAAGPFGLAGRIGAAGLGVAAGAGEARGRAEEAQATEGERGVATALGTIPGALESLPPVRLLRRFGFGDEAVKEVAGLVPALTRVAKAGGEEALQEASTQVLQNLIAKGVYKPDEAVFGGVGEAAALGGGAGAVISAIAELALGRRLQRPNVPPSVERPDEELYQEMETELKAAEARRAEVGKALEEAVTMPQEQATALLEEAQQLDKQIVASKQILNRHKRQQKAETPEQATEQAPAQPAETGDFGVALDEEAAAATPPVTPQAQEFLDELPDSLFEGMEQPAVPAPATSSLPPLVSVIGNLYAQGLKTPQVLKQLDKDGLLNQVPAKQRTQAVEAVRQQLGVPSRATPEGRVAFKTWANQWQTSNSSPAVSSTPVATEVISAPAARETVSASPVTASTEVVTPAAEAPSQVTEQPVVEAEAAPVEETAPAAPAVPDPLVEARKLVDEKGNPPTAATIRKTLGERGVTVTVPQASEIRKTLVGERDAARKKTAEEKTTAKKKATEEKAPAAKKKKAEKEPVDERLTNVDSVEDLVAIITGREDREVSDWVGSRVVENLTKGYTRLPAFDQLRRTVRKPDGKPYSEGFLRQIEQALEQKLGGAVATSASAARAQRASRAKRDLQAAKDEGRIDNDNFIRASNALREYSAGRTEDLSAVEALLTEADAKIKNAEEGKPETAPEPKGKELEREQLLKEVDGRTLTEALDILIATSSNPVYRLLALKVRPLIRGLIQAKLLVNTKIVVTKAVGPANGDTSHTVVTNPETGLDTIESVVRLHPDRAYYRTLLHELLHVATIPVRQLARTAKKRKLNNDLTKIIDDYDAITNHIGRALMIAAKHPSETRRKLQAKGLTPDQAGVILDYLTALESTNVLKFDDGNNIVGFDPDEVFSWALSDETVGIVISNIVPPIKKKLNLVNAATEFVNLIRRMLGLAESAQSALEQLYGVVQTLGDRAQIVVVESAMLPKIAPFSRVTPEKQKPVRLKAPPRQARKMDRIIEDGVASLNRTSGRSDPGLLRRILNMMNYRGYSAAVTTWQNSRRALKELQDSLERTGTLIVDIKGKFNNFYDYIQTSAGRAQNIILERFKNHFDRQSDLVREFAKKRNISNDEAMSLIDSVMKALHIPERRRMLFLRVVPLNTTRKVFKVTNPDGTTEMVSAATIRHKIFNKLYEKTGNLTGKEKEAWLKQISQYRDLLLKITEPGSPYIDKAGESMGVTNATDAAAPTPGKTPTDINDAYYNVLGDFPQKEIDELTAEYGANKADYDPIINVIQDIIKATRKTDMDSNYWTPGVDNVVEFYGWKNYVPFKGEPGAKLTEAAENIDPRGKLFSPDFKSDVQAAPFSGRNTDATNVLIQVQRDGIKASLRLGQWGSRTAIYNAINSPDKIIAAKKLGEVKFSERNGPEAEKLLYKGNNRFMYYAPNGDIVVYEITDPAIREAIRQSYQEDSLMRRLTEFMSSATSMISRGYTFYNPAFAPKDFFRNVFTNAGIIFLEKSPAAFAHYSWMVGLDVARGGPFKGYRMALLHERGEFGKMRELAEKNPGFYKPAYEYLMNGGQTTYAQALAAKGKFEEIHKEFLRDPRDPKLAYRWVRQWFSYWANGFELASRMAVYRIRKLELMNQGIDDASAQVSATAYAKGTANFEEVGTKGRAMGAYYMFSRPSATGAVRALDAVAPLLVSDYRTLLARLPDSIKNDPVALRKAKANIDKQARNAKLLALSFLSVGYLLYMMSRNAFDGEDEEGRNIIATDNKELWTRNLRIPLKPLGLSDDPKAVFQLPWGFGLGAFMALGAQFGALLAGDISMKQLAGNLTTINLDSFLPLPVARFNPLEPPEGMNQLESTVYWTLDSVAPSTARPLIEYFANINSLGQRIYNNTSNKYGDAYVTAENIPDAYNDAVQFIEDKLRLDIKPEGLYYFVNTFMGGMNSLVVPAYGLASSLQGDKELDVKRDLFFTSGFVGKVPNIDAAQYAKAERNLLDLEREVSKVEGLLTRKPERFAEFMEENPLATTAIERYRKLKSQIDQIQADKKLVRSGQYGPMTTRERKEILEAMDAQLNFHKRIMVETYNNLMEMQGKEGVR